MVQLNEPNQKQLGLVRRDRLRAHGALHPPERRRAGGPEGQQRRPSSIRHRRWRRCSGCTTGCGRTGRWPSRPSPRRPWASTGGGARPGNLAMLTDGSWYVPQLLPGLPSEADQWDIAVLAEGAGASRIARQHRRLGDLLGQQAAKRGLDLMKFLQTDAWMEPAIGIGGHEPARKSWLDRYPQLDEAGLPALADKNLASFTERASRTTPSRCSCSSGTSISARCTTTRGRRCSRATSAPSPTPSATRPSRSTPSTPHPSRGQGLALALVPIS